MFTQRSRQPGSTQWKRYAQNNRFDLKKTDDKGRVAERKSAARPFFVLESTATGKNVENPATIHLK